MQSVRTARNKGAAGHLRSRLVRIRAQIGQSVKRGAQRDFHLNPRQMLIQTGMRSGPKG